MATIKVNNVDHDISAFEPDMPLLWFLREQLGLTGTKFGCGLSMCGACTVLINGDPVRACITELQDVGGAIVTIEGLSNGTQLHPVQQAWVEKQVPQCGYCQSGQILTAVSLLNQNPNPDADEIEQFMSGNICRCGTYNEIRAAVTRAAQLTSAARNGSGGG